MACHHCQNTKYPRVDRYERSEDCRIAIQFGTGQPRCMCEEAARLLYQRLGEALGMHRDAARKGASDGR